MVLNGLLGIGGRGDVGPGGGGGGGGVGVGVGVGVVGKGFVAGVLLPHAERPSKTRTKITPINSLKYFILRLFPNNVSPLVKIVKILFI